MHIFVGNIPGNATLLELQRFLGDHKMSVDYSSHRHGNSTQTDAHFLLIKTNSNESADDLIQELNGKRFRDVPLEARRFIQRQPNPQWKGVDRRSYQLDLDLIFP